MTELEIRNPHVARAAALVGGIKALAEKLKVTRAAIYAWPKDRVPPKRAVEIDRLTEGKVSRAELCPDVFEPTVDAAQ